MKLNPNEKQKEAVLLEFCKQNQGPAIRVMNQHQAPNATTYRGAFCDGAADLFRLYRDIGVKFPLRRMSLRFTESEIRSCRGNEMGIGVTAYLYEKRLAKRLKGKQFLIPEKITKEECPICKKRKINLNQHMLAVHGNQI